MNEKEKTIKNILNSVKLDVDDISGFGNEIDAIITMFNNIKDVDVENISADLNKKKITLDELRIDEPKSWDFRKEMRGKYFKVPSVSRK